MTEQSTTESTTEDSSSYVSRSATVPPAENKATGANNGMIAVAFCLAILAALIILFLLFSGSSSSSGAHAGGAGDGDDDSTTTRHSHVVKPTGPPPPSATTPKNITTPKTPARTTPASTTPASTTPASTTPARTTPARTTPASTRPASTTPASTTPARTTPARTTPTSTRPASTTPASTTPARTTPARTTTARTTPARTTTARTTPASTTPASTTPRKSTGWTSWMTTTVTTTTTTQRPIPPDTIVCTYGPGITASSPFPDDGVCDFIVLEQMPSSTPGDFGGPWPTGVQHFVDTAAQYSKTEFVAAFDYDVRKMTDNATQDPSVKQHVHTLFSKRIFHYGYINTDTYQLTKTSMAFLMRILKRITDYLEDMKTPDRPIYTFMSSTWSEEYDIVSAPSVAEISRTIRMPDMYISKAHLYEDDSIYKECKILPPNLLKEPHDMTEHHVYFYDLYSALKHASDIDKLRDQGMKTTALSVSVGVYGRWYNVKGLKDEDKFSPGEGCFQRFIKEQMASIATVCEGWKYEIAKSESYSCEYAMDPNTTRTFAYDTPKTLNYKLCMSKKNVTSLQYGFTVARLEYSDVSNVCGLGKFPLLTTVKKTLTFLKNYKSADDFEECLKYQANRRTGEKRATLDDE